MFDGCTSLMTIPLTNVLLSGPNTFRNCATLPFADLTITTVLPANTFYGCTNLAEVTAPLVTAVGDSAFEASGLVTFNSDTNGNASFARIVTIGDRAFYGTSIQLVSDMNSVDRVGTSAFEDCGGLSGNVVMPIVTVIGDRAFYGTSAARFEFGSVLRSIGDLALFDQNLAFILVDAQNSDYVTVDGILYNKDRTELIVIPAKLERSNVELPAGLSVIDHFAAYGAMIDGELVIPAGVREIA